jgi:spore maturation protein CgeB
LAGARRGGLAVAAAGNGEVMLRLRIAVLGLSITSSWGNGHATTWRALLKALAGRGHSITFLERDVPWYRAHRDLPRASWCQIALYKDLAELRRRFASKVAEADVVVVGSYVPDGVAVARWVQATSAGVIAFYDIDTPVTLAKLARGDHEYLAPELIPRFDLYLSFAGGPSLACLEQAYGARRARALYCAVDPAAYHPLDLPERFALGYLGTYSADRQPAAERLLIEPARALPEERFVVAGPQYPEDLAWPGNVLRHDHVPPRRHPEFYSQVRFALNLTRADMVVLGWSPSVRLFEAAACGVPIISDDWPGLAELMAPGREILIAHGAADVVRYLREVGPDERAQIGQAARARVLAAHTAAHRAKEFEREVLAAGVRRPPLAAQA